MKTSRNALFIVIVIVLLVLGGNIFAAKTATMLISGEALGAMEITAETTTADTIFSNLSDGSSATAYQIGTITVKSVVFNYTVSATSANLGYLEDSDTPSPDSIAYTVEVLDTAAIVSTGYQSLTATPVNLIDSSPATGATPITLEVYIQFTTDPALLVGGNGAYTDTITFTIGIV